MCVRQNGHGLGPANWGRGTRTSEVLESVTAQHCALSCGCNLGGIRAGHCDAHTLYSVDAHRCGSGRATKKFRRHFLHRGTDRHTDDEGSFNPVDAGQLDDFADLRLHPELAQRIEDSLAFPSAEPGARRNFYLGFALSAGQTHDEGIKGKPRRINGGESNCGHKASK